MYPARPASASVFDPAQRFVLCCLADDLAGAGTALDDGANLEEIVHFALRHEVVGEVAAFAARVALALPPDVEAGLADFAARIAEQRDRVSVITLAVGAALEAAGLAAVFAKGAVWDACLRRADTTRTIKDLDLYVRRDEVTAAVECLEARFHAIAEPAVKDEARRLHHRRLWLPDAEVMVEVHWHVASPRHNIRFDLDRAIACARPVPLDGGQVSGLSDEHVVLFCAVELGKDSWASLKKITDFAVAVGKGGDAAFEAALSEARAAGSARILRIGVLVAQGLGLPLAVPAAEQGARGDVVAVRIARICLARLARGTHRPGFSVRAREGLALARKHDRAAAQAYHVWRIILLRRLQGW